MQGFCTKKAPKRSFLLFVEENSSDEGRELLVGFGGRELGSPAEVKFHETRMGLVVKDDLGITAGLCPLFMLASLCGSERVFVIIPFVLDKDLVGTGTGFFAGKRVTEMFFLGDRDVIHALFGCFLESAGDAIDPVATSSFCHNGKDND